MEPKKEYRAVVVGGLPCTALRGGTFAHPTLAESLNRLFGSLSE
jgi:hypothetical protein